MKLIETFSYVNITVDALSGKYTLLSILDAKILGFEYIKDLYVDDPHFRKYHLDNSLGIMFFFV